MSVYKIQLPSRRSTAKTILFCALLVGWGSFVQTAITYALPATADALTNGHVPIKCGIYYRVCGLIDKSSKQGNLIKYMSLIDTFRSRSNSPNAQYKCWRPAY